MASPCPWLGVSHDAGGTEGMRRQEVWSAGPTRLPVAQKVLEQVGVRVRKAQGPGESGASVL